jgi:hypothetical protein
LKWAGWSKEGQSLVQERYDGSMNKAEKRTLGKRKMDKMKKC